MTKKILTICLAATVISLGLPSCKTHRVPELNLQNVEEGRYKAEDGYKFLQDDERDIIILMKAKEKLISIQVDSKTSRDACFVFSSGRVYQVFFAKGERLKYWSGEKIVTDRRTVTLHWYQEVK